MSCGLLDYLQGIPEGPLFPGLKQGGPDRKFGAYLTKRFTVYRRSCGVVRDRVGFHSFRKNFATALDIARVPQADVATLLGHETTFTRSIYSPLGPQLSTLQEHVEHVSYPGLVTSHLQN